MAKPLSSKPSSVGALIEAAGSKAALEAGARAEIAGVDPGGIKKPTAKRLVRPAEPDMLKAAKRRVKVAG
jgi:hypothetical protein